MGKQKYNIAHRSAFLYAGGWNDAMKYVKADKKLHVPLFDMIKFADFWREIQTAQNESEHPEQFPIMENVLHRFIKMRNASGSPEEFQLMLDDYIQDIAEKGETVSK